MLPSEHIHHIFNQMLVIFLRMLGVNYIDPTYNRKNPWTIFIASGMLMGIMAGVYTLIFLDSDTRMKCMSLFPIGLQGIIKYQMFTTSAHIHRSHVSILKGIYTQCDLHEQEAVVLCVWARIFKRVIKSFVICVVTATCGFCIVPPFLYFTTGEFTILLPFILPYFSLNTFPGYGVQIMFQILIISISAIGVLSADLSLFMQILHVCPLSKILVLKLRRLESMLTDFPDFSQRRQTTTFLNNYIRMHKEYFMYIKSMADAFYITILVEVMLNGLCMCIVIFVLLQISWFPLYMLWITFMTKTLITCALGTISEHYVSVSSMNHLLVLIYPAHDLTRMKVFGCHSKHFRGIC